MSSRMGFLFATILFCLSLTLIFGANIEDEFLDNKEEFPDIIIPDDMNSSLDRAIKFAGGGEPEKTEAVFAKCIEVFAEDAIFYYNLGVFQEYGEEGRYDGDLNQAIATYKDCLNVDKNFIPALINMGILYQKLGFLEETRRLYERVLDISPDEKTALFNLGSLYHTMDEPENAKKNFERYTEVFPQDDRGWRCLAVIYEELDETGKAIKSWKEAFQNATNAKWATYSQNRLIELRGY